jgi:hypothetical protein
MEYYNVTQKPFQINYNKNAQCVNVVMGPGTIIGVHFTKQMFLSRNNADTNGSQQCLGMGLVCR